MTGKEYRPQVNLSSSNTGGRQANGNYNHYSYYILHFFNRYGYNSITFYSSKHRLANNIFFRFLPSVNNYYKALEAITKLRIFMHDKWTKAYGTKSETAYSNVTQKDTGFRELIEVFKDNGYLETVRTEDIDEVRITKTVPQMTPEEAHKILSEFFRFPATSKLKLPESVGWVSIITKGEELLVLSFYDEWASQGVIRMADEQLKKKLSKYIVGLVVAWLVLNSFLVLYINLVR